VYHCQRNVENELHQNIYKLQVKIIRYTDHMPDYEYFVFYSFYKYKLRYYEE
jgi:hypothetical protein